jgi:hypothetical protein
VTYWIANHIFDLSICLFNIVTMVCSLKLINSVRDDSTVEIYSIGSDPQIGYFFLLLFLSAFSWTTLAYIWSLLFKSEIIGFVVLAIILGVAAFLYMILAFVILLIQTDSGSTNGSKLINFTRVIFTILFPNVLVKRGMFDLKITKNSYCISSLNKIINSKFFQFQLIQIILIFCAKATYSTDTPLYSTSEPGIGALLSKLSA